MLREEGLRGDDARTTGRAIGRCRELQGKGTREPVAVCEFRIAKRQSRPMPADRQASRASAVAVGDHDGMTEFGRLGVVSQGWWKIGELA